MEECKNRWKNVRDTFMRRKRNRKLPTGSARSRKPRKWYLERSLMFLNKVENERSTLTSTTVQEDLSNDHSDEENYSQTEDVDIEGMNDDDTVAESQPMIFNEIEEQQPKNKNETMIEQQPKKICETAKEQPAKRMNEPDDNRKKKHAAGRKEKMTDRIFHILEKNSEERQKLLSNTFEKKTETEHPIDAFFRSMAASVKKMSEERQIRAKMQVCQIVGQLELEEVSSRSSSTAVATLYEDDISRQTSTSYGSSIQPRESPFNELFTNTSGRNFI